VVAAKRQRLPDSLSVASTGGPTVRVFDLPDGIEMGSLRRDRHNALGEFLQPARRVEHLQPFEEADQIIERK
jgi:hypothetical protein